MATIVIILATSKSMSEFQDFTKDVAAFWRCQISDNAWAIDSKLDIAIIKEELTSHLTSNECLFIGYLSPKWACYNGQRLTEWLSNPTRRWTKVAPKSMIARLLGRRD